jgi:hypothetical protein
MRIVFWRQALFGIDRQLMREVINAGEFTATFIHGSIIFSIEGSHYFSQQRQPLPQSRRAIAAGWSGR